MTTPDHDAMNSLRELFESKFEETGKAVRLLQENSNRQPTPEVLAKEIEGLRREMGIFFSEMEKRNAAVAASDQKSIDVALQAQKEAAAKSENSQSKQMDASNEQMRQGFAALETRLNDTRDSVSTIVAGGQGKQQSQTGMIAVASLVIAAIVAATIVLSKFGT